MYRARSETHLSWMSNHFICRRCTSERCHSLDFVITCCTHCCRMREAQDKRQYRNPRRLWRSGAKRNVARKMQNQRKRPLPRRCRRRLLPRSWRRRWNPCSRMFICSQARSKKKMSPQCQEHQKSKRQENQKPHQQVTTILHLAPEDARRGRSHANFGVTEIADWEPIAIGGTRKAPEARTLQNIIALCHASIFSRRRVASKVIVSDYVF